MKHIIAVLVENEPGRCRASWACFRRVATTSIVVGGAHRRPSLSRMTIQTSGSDDVIEQITKHLNRLIEVVRWLTSLRLTLSAR